MSTTTQTPTTLDELSPRSSRTGANKDSTLFYIGISFLMHLALLLGTSSHFIYDNYIDPVGAKERAAAKAAADAAAAAAAATQASGITTTTAAAKPKPDAAKPASEKPADGSKPADPAKPGDNTPMGKTLNEATPSKDIPKNPDGLGLDLNDTQIKK